MKVAFIKKGVSYVLVLRGLVLPDEVDAVWADSSRLSWLWVLSPFALAVAWWAWADSSGYTKRLAAEKEQKRKQDRVNASRANLGMVSKTTKRK